MSRAPLAERLAIRALGMLGALRLMGARA